jgi:hypothetical protein
MTWQIDGLRVGIRIGSPLRRPAHSTGKNQAVGGGPSSALGWTWGLGWAGGLAGVWGWGLG